MQQSLPDAPLDIIGDIHGEFDALKALLHHLGYNNRGHHPQGRRLVFVGDLCDRGPDSPGVIALVRRLVEDDKAQAIMGNHELNLLRGDRKDGNNWFWDDVNPKEHKFEPYARINPAEREGLLSFIGQLPLILQREDLRVIHAAWDDNAMTQLLARSSEPLLDLFDEWERQTDAELAKQGLLSESKAEEDAWKHALSDSDQIVPLLQATGLCDELRQMSNPVRVLVSGVERLAREPFYSSGKWRFTDRIKWWDHYETRTPVVVGHYWRQFSPVDRKQFGKGDSNLFDDIAPTHWHGARGNVFCVDFSVGGRYQERRGGARRDQGTKLAALRWPERTLVLDSGETLDTGGFRD
ncbi:MAG: hypothetical protein A3H44_08245 [Gammaproteobacteria bacterium RIFCSPLOWO2_02_FULL_57_10]|nr:MAG: hypothetical protein A3H44_08245 [Gammaproteobacteria bacterium RIFCSPLOWO2_02_FULL_57_10]